jgi:hypothetical protein
MGGGVYFNAQFPHLLGEVIPILNKGGRGPGAGGRGAGGAHTSLKFPVPFCAVKSSKTILIEVIFLVSCVVTRL